MQFHVNVTPPAPPTPAPVVHMTTEAAKIMARQDNIRLLVAAGLMAGGLFFIYKITTSFDKD